jgi:pimeloyl-ACP methyl ester carboxylesterase
MNSKALSLLAFACGLAGCGGGGGSSDSPPQAEVCATADNITRVRGGNECLVIRTVAGSGTPTGLLVMVHGDVSAGGPADYLYPFAQKYSGPGIVAVALLRPGYFDAQGNTSTGTNYDRIDSYTEANIAAVAGAVQQLQQFHKVSKVVYVGHSGGAAIGGVIAGRYPDLLDNILLVGCPCNIPVWRMDRGAAPWVRSLSPHDFIATVRPDAHIVALTGTLDPNTFPHLASDYVASLTQRGVNASYVPIPGAMHNWGEGISQSAQFDTALKSALAGL